MRKSIAWELLLGLVVSLAIVTGVQRARITDPLAAAVQARPRVF
jgi:hypothetical protein